MQAKGKEESLLETNQLLPSWISLRRILTKILSLAASSGSSPPPSAEDQLVERQSNVRTRSWQNFTELDQIGRLLLISSQHFGKDLALQGFDGHGIFLQHKKKQQADLT